MPISRVTARDISKRYGKRAVLNGASFSLRAGECVGILGGNGSGKSTLLSVLAGVLAPDGGSFTAELEGGGEIDLLSPRARRGQVGYVPQGTPLIPELSARDNLRLFYSRKELSRACREGGVLERLGVLDFLRTPVRRLSGGMAKRLAIACALAGDPPLLLLDEPTAALDIPCKEMIREALASLKAGGTAILLVTHDEGDFPLCDRILLLRGGRLEETPPGISPEAAAMLLKENAPA